MTTEQAAHIPPSDGVPAEVPDPAPDPAPASPIGPVTRTERIEILDVLRGFAIMGILVVNIPGFARPSLTLDPPEPHHWYDVIAADASELLFTGKFYTTFSFLFGVGFCLQLARADARGRDIRSFYHRRLLALLVLGVLHAALLWPGEILRLYAVLGFALLAFRRRRTKTLLIWAAASMGFAFVAYLGFLGIIAAAGWNEGHIVFAGIDLMDFSREAYASAWPWPVVGFQTALLPLGTLSLYLTQGPISLAMFLVGMAVGRSQLFERLRQRRATLRKVLYVTLPVGLALSALLLLGDDPVAIFVGMPSTPVLAAGYVSGLSLLSLTAVGGRVLRPLANVGRMALSNYVLQSVICSVLFNGYGLGWHDKIGDAGLLGVAVAIVAVQVPLSGWWLSRYRFGPLEWVWRSVTYRRRQPMRRPAAGTPRPDGGPALTG